jgi:hypothetical protein
MKQFWKLDAFQAKQDVKAAVKGPLVRVLADKAALLGKLAASRERAYS